LKKGKELEEEIEDLKWKDFERSFFFSM